MKKKASYIERYIQYAQEMISEQLSQKKLTVKVKTDLNARLDALEDIKSKLEWQLLSPLERQAARIDWLEDLIREDKDVQLHMKTVIFYEKIYQVLPYIKVLNKNDGLHDLYDWCVRQIDKIDFKGKAFHEFEIEQDEFMEAFVGFFKLPEEEMNPIALSKVSELYDMLNDSFYEDISIYLHSLNRFPGNALINPSNSSLSNTDAVLFMLS